MTHCGMPIKDGSGRTPSAGKAVSLRSPVSQIHALLGHFLLLGKVMAPIPTVFAMLITWPQATAFKAACNPDVVPAKFDAQLPPGKSAGLIGVPTQSVIPELGVPAIEVSNAVKAASGGKTPFE